MKTQAFVLTKKGNADEAFSLREVELSSLSASQVLIEVEAFGLNYADVMARKGLYRETPSLPAVIGYEVVGVIARAGDASNNHLIGKRVVAFCRFGGYARHVITEVHAVAEIDDVPASEALALATQWVTAYYMVEKAANVREGDKVLIHAAAGGVGTALIQLCKQKGAIVCAKIGSETKASIVNDLGADQVVYYKGRDYVEGTKAWLGASKLDVSFNPVAGTTFKKDLKLLGSGGRLVLFGGSELSGKWGFFSTLSFVWKMGFVIPIGLMMGSKTIAGVNMLRIADDKPQLLSRCLHEVVKLYREEHIRVIVGGIYPVSNFEEAHAALEAGTTIGKLAVIWDE